MTKWYVYAHTNPLTGAVFYIGSGTGVRAHSSANRTTKWKLYVSHLLDKGLTYSISLLHICNTKEESLDLERIEIRSKLLSGHALLNTQVYDDKTIDTEFDRIEEVNLTETSSFICRKRKSVGLTQRTLASKAGVGLRFVRELEQGKRTLRLDKVNQVLNLFGSKLIPREKT